jgi:hypothetical protein
MPCDRDGEELFGSSMVQALAMLASWELAVSKKLEGSPAKLFLKFF